MSEDKLEFIATTGEAIESQVTKRIARTNREPKLKELPETINCSELSEDSQDVIKYFGLECPALLNDYCNSVEDALIEQVDKVKRYTEALEAINIHRKELDLENSLLHRRLNLISKLIKRKQVEDIAELIGQPL